MVDREMDGMVVVPRSWKLRMGNGTGRTRRGHKVCATDGSQGDMASVLIRDTI